MCSRAGWPCRCSAAGRVLLQAWEAPCCLPCQDQADPLLPESGAGGNTPVLSACLWLPCRHHALPPGRWVPTARACRLQHPKAGTWQSHVRHRAVGWWRTSCFLNTSESRMRICCLTASGPTACRRLCHTPSAADGWAESGEGRLALSLLLLSLGDGDARLPRQQEKGQAPEPPPRAGAGLLGSSRLGHCPL